MKSTFFTRLGLASGMLLIAAAAQAAVDPSPHRKVDAQGVGNCVFSTNELSRGEDSSYKLTNSFKAPQSVHARCYFPKTLDNYSSAGKFANSMRDTHEYWTSLMIQRPDGLTVIDRGLYDFDGTWDQQRFDIDGTAENADFGLKGSEAERYGASVKSTDTSEMSLNLPNYVKALAVAANKFPYTAKFCMDVYTDIADSVHEESKYDDFSKKWITKQVPQTKSYIISRGCFDYTINSASDVSWTPGKTSNAGTPAEVAEQTPEDQAKDLLKGLGF
jgi:hypothetical protein